MADEKYPINIWINEDRFAKLESAGLAGMCEEMLAGLKVLRVYANDAQRDKILAVFPTAKFDSATTKSIELLPKDAKDGIFAKCVEKKSVEVLDDYLSAF
jgi:hypothetical protein